MGFLNTDSMPRLVEKLADGDNIKITGNSKGNRVGTVVKKIVEKADDVTKAIEQEVINDSYSFKVGTGDVDVSADVEDGFGEVGIKGVTYQNVLPVGMFDSKENFYALGGQVSDLHSSFDSGYITLNATGDYGNAFVKLEKTLLKQNSKYTLILDIKNTNLTLKEEIDSTKSSFAVATAHPSEVFVERVLLGGNAYPLKNGIQKFLLTTKSDFTGVDWSTRMFISDNVASGSITFRFLLLEGDHTNNPNLPSYFEGIVGIGDKSKNLFDSGLKLGNISWETGVENNLQQHVMSAEYIKVRPNTKYIIHSNTSHKLNLYFYDNSKVISAPSLEGVAISFTTNSTTEYIKVLSVNNTDLSNSRFQLEEGDVATSYEPYHDGYKIEILSNGKNIFDKSTITDNSYINENGDIISYNGWFSSDFIRVHKGEKYYIYNEKHREPFAGLYSYYYDVNKNKIERLNLGDTEFIGIKEFVSKYDGYIRISGITRHIEKGKFYTSSDKTQILLDEPLMRLPNGVCDEITRDGKLIRRVGKVVFDGSEDWETTINLDGLTYRYSLIFKFKTSDNHYNVDNIICNDLATKNFPNIYNNGEKGITTWWSDDYIRKAIVICLSNNYSLEQFKEWLSQNPITVYYELETPITTELPAPYLRIFKDGHLTFNTLVAPESNHVVQLNKSAQIERSIREVQSLDSRVGKLESFYDDMMLETNHKLSLLNYDFEYTRERNGE